MFDPCSGSQRNNNKLECFLKRSLTSERYHRLRAYEACIVEKTFKFIIIGDQCVYLTENPPRNLQPVIFYEELSDVDLVHDLPNFLQGLEREQTLHIVLTYHRKFQKKTPDGVGVDVRQSQNSMFRNSLFARTQQQRPRGASSDRKTMEAQSPRASYDVKKTIEAQQHQRTPNARKTSFDETLLQSSRYKVNMNQAAGNNTLASMSLPSSLRHTLERSGTGSHTESRGTRDELSTNKYKFHSSLIQRIQRPFWRVWYNLVNIKRHRISQSRQMMSDTQQNMDDNKNKSLPQARDSAEPKTKAATAGGGGSTLLSSSKSGPWMSSRDAQEYILHVYLLKQNSPILDNLRYAWDNFLIRTTEQMSNGGGTYMATEQMSDGRWKDLVTEDSFSLSEQPELLFSRLKQDILSVKHNPTLLLQFTSRLHTSALTCFAIKKLFWKDAELFRFLVDVLCEEVPVFLSSGTSCDSKRPSYKLSLLCGILEIVKVMFRETEVLSSRISTLNSARESSFKLIQLLVCLLSNQQTPINRKNQSQCVKSLTSPEMTQLVTGVVYELFLCLQQKLNGNSEDICTSWLVGIVEGIGAEAMIYQLVSEVLEVTKPHPPLSSMTNTPEVSCMSSLHVLQLYQRCYILAIILDNSPQLAEHIHTNYLTEFKYLVQAPLLKQRLSTHCPLSNTALQLVMEVQRKIVY